MPGQPGGVPGAFGDLARLGGQGPGPSQEGAGTGGLDERGHLHPGRRQAGRHGQQQGPGAGDDGGAAGHDEAPLEHRLGAARTDHTGQGPAREGQHLLVAAGGQEDGVGAHLGRLLLLGAEQCVHRESVLVPLDEPDVMVRQMPYRARPYVGPQAVPQSLPGPPLVVQCPRATGAQRGGGLPVELPAGLRGRVEQRDVHSLGRRGEGRGESGRPRADHREVR